MGNREQRENKYFFLNLNSVYHDIWWLGDKVVTNQYNFSFDIEIEFEANPRPDPVIWKMQFEKGRNGATVDEGKSRRTYEALDIEEDVSIDIH